MSIGFTPVILSGGYGARLWPMSRRLLPKQFLPLLSEKTLFQETALRASKILGCGAPIIVCNDEQRFLGAEQLREIGIAPRRMILEPVGRNTAPAIAVAALEALEADPHALLLVLPSDHAITKPEAFAQNVTEAMRQAQAGKLVTFGVRPENAATAYGYIEQGAPVGSAARCWAVASFREKPDRATAEAFLASGKFYWNSGMFAFGAQRYFDELERLRPDIAYASARAYRCGAADLDFYRLDKASLEQCPSESIDYAVMEKTRDAVVLGTDTGWSDVGAWPALWELARKDGDGNVSIGDVQLRGTKNCYVRSENRLVSALGVESLVIVETDDAVLVAAMDQAQDVKEVVGSLDALKRTEHVSHSRVYRPWGYFESIDGGERYKVKRIVVKPGAALSLQMHHRRAEHWVVVSGTARVTRGEEVLTLTANQSTFIPLGTKHRLENPGDAPLYLVEVQSGEYLGEDDIVRFADQYNRT